ncbi:PTB domain-containing engulfment adapter protein 1 isoform X3 [Narcine bancroftii]|uniref:PTB domain-containing engulfment adapter protein 1 isoform X3 n=1 Tax=Narcine bancroftii TaxID=1343680 RepID=UPI0038312110
MNRAFSRKKDKTWIHSPEALTKHFIPYNVKIPNFPGIPKFLGNAEVEQPKGTEIVKDAVRKLKFARHIKKSEGQKTPKVELQISIYGVKILEAKTKENLHNCQLHRISFCADDKTDKKIFTFICKDAESNKHMCYVFDSEKCAEEITLTIGQAFDLAYKKFLETGGKDVETRKQIASLQKRIQELETENIELKKKVQELEIKVNVTKDPTSPLLHMSSRNQLQFCQSASTLFWSDNMEKVIFPEITSFTLSPTSTSGSSLTEGLLTPPSPKNNMQQIVDGLSIPRPHRVMAPPSPSTDLFDMVPFSPASPLLPIPSSNGTELPPLPIRSSETKRDIFGAEPFDPFISVGGDFPPDIQSKLDEMQQRQRWRGSKWD